MKREDTDTERGLVILSALINFADWLNDPNTLPLSVSKQERGKLVLKFMETHSKGKNVFIQAEDIAARLGVPFGRSNEPCDREKRVAKRILNSINFKSRTTKDEQENIETVVEIMLLNQIFND